MSRTALSAMHPSYCHVALFHSLLHCRTECWWLFHFSCALVLISPDIDMLPPCATCQVKEMSSWNSDTCSTKGLIFLNRNRNRFNVKNIIRSINQFLVFFFIFLILFIFSLTYDHKHHTSIYLEPNVYIKNIFLKKWLSDSPNRTSIANDG